MKNRLLKWLNEALGQREEVYIPPEKEQWPEEGLICAPDYDESVHHPTCRVLVSPGDQITAGKLLVELEMSWHLYEVISPSSGIVDEVLVTSGDYIGPGEALITLSRIG